MGIDLSTPPHLIHLGAHTASSSPTGFFSIHALTREIIATSVTGGHLRGRGYMRRPDDSRRRRSERGCDLGPAGGPTSTRPDVCCGPSAAEWKRRPTVSSKVALRRSTIMALDRGCLDMGQRARGCALLHAAATVSFGGLFPRPHTPVTASSNLPHAPTAAWLLRHLLRSEIRPPHAPPAPSHVGDHNAFLPLAGGLGGGVTPRPGPTDRDHDAVPPIRRAGRGLARA
jgi:hypothetical protein